VSLHGINVGANAPEKNLGGESVLPETGGSQYSSSRTSLKLFSPDAGFFTLNASISISAVAPLQIPLGSSQRLVGWLSQRSCSSLYRLPRFINCPTYITLHYSVVERRSLTGELSLVCIGPAADG